MIGLLKITDAKSWQSLNRGPWGRNGRYCYAWQCYHSHLYLHTTKNTTDSCPDGLCIIIMPWLERFITPPSDQHCWLHSLLPDNLTRAGMYTQMSCHGGLSSTYYNWKLVIFIVGTRIRMEDKCLTVMVSQ